MARAVALSSLLAVVAAAAYLLWLLGPAYGWPLIGLAAPSASAAVLLVLEHPHARGVLLITAFPWAALPIPFLLALALGAGGDPLPGWVFPAVLAMLAAGAASVVAFVAGSLHLRG